MGNRQRFRAGVPETLASTGDDERIDEWKPLTLRRHRMRGRAASLVIAGLGIVGGACSTGDSASVGESLDAAPTSDSAQPSVDVAAVEATPKDVEATDWGPLAVLARRGGAEGLVTGVLSISSTCVLLNGSFLVAWPAELVAWDSDENAVVIFDDGATRRAIGRLRDGDSVELGGGQVSMTAAASVPVVWVQEPHPDCLTDADGTIAVSSTEPMNRS